MTEDIQTPSSVMEEKRLELHNILVTALGTSHVYFQPPATVKMTYPAIIYNRDNIHDRFANNKSYIRKYAYQVTVIDADPDSSIVEKVSLLPLARFERHFTSDNLNHDVFQIYY